MDPAERRRVQRRTVLVLSTATVLAGFATGASLSVGALVLAELSGNDAISGLASAVFNGGAAIAGIPLARIAARRGRRSALVAGSAVAVAGAVVAILSAAIGSWPLFALGVAMLGVSSAVSLLARFAATDLALPENRARDLSFVVWSITVGAVVGPNLIGPGEAVGLGLGIPPLAGVFVFALAAQLLAALVNWIGLRPDPLLVSRLLPPETGSVATPARPAETAAVAASRTPGRDRDPAPPAPPSGPGARWLAILAIAMAQAIMVALMAMTPLHLMHHEGTPEIVGVTLSLHIAGMYALSPVFGTLASRLGRVPVISLGWVMLLASVAIAYAAGPSHLLVQLSLTLLGLGWSAVTVAGAALLTELTPSAERPRWQGRSDTIMSAAGAVAGALSGVAFALGDFSFLALLAGGLLALGAAASIPLGSRARGARSR
ncbi:MFS transporter [Leucobacter sp. CSA1]|uniref:MFS transporter n=1 Tax=Leucobacter chromiisoli TaxID=2796471 RepID=A0A934UWF4_9MICO|nr:MFS transporter [Leucobacter chromiisoli]